MYLLGNQKVEVTSGTNIHSKMVYPFLSVTIVGDTLPYIMKMTTIRWYTAQPDHVNVKVKVVVMV